MDRLMHWRKSLLERLQGKYLGTNYIDRLIHEKARSVSF